MDLRADKRRLFYGNKINLRSGVKVSLSVTEQRLHVVVGAELEYTVDVRP